MNSLQPSALPDASGNSDEGLASFGARYQAFLNQQPPKIQQKSSALSGLTFLIQGLVNIAIFLALFLAILALLGFGLSRLNRISGDAQENVSVMGKRARISGAETPALPLKKRVNHN